MPKGDPRHQEGLQTVERPKVKRPPLFKVLLHNDDYTTMEFVVEILVRFFHKDVTEATQVMLHVHTKGMGVAGVYSRDIAETKVAQVTGYARESGMPLKLTLEPE